MIFKQNRAHKGNSLKQKNLLKSLTTMNCPPSEKVLFLFLSRIDIFVIQPISCLLNTNADAAEEVALTNVRLESWLGRNCLCNTGDGIIKSPYGPIWARFCLKAISFNEKS